MPVLQSAVQLLSLMIMCVTSFGSLQSLAAIDFSTCQMVTDSQNTARIIETWSWICTGLLLKFFSFARNTVFVWKWIPQTENEKADYISHLLDLNDRQITHHHFLSLEELWGPHTVDCFANYYAAKLARFFSHFWNPCASGIYFFNQELSCKNSSVVPLVSLVAQISHYLNL